jgi:nucleoside-diphosphate-sugar epimerase
MLRERGWTVRALSHTRAPDGVDETVSGSITDAATMRAAVRGCSAVVHLAARTHARSSAAYRTVNVDGTRVVCESAAQEGVARLLVVGTHTASTVGGAYSASKLAAESIVRASGLDWTLVRLAELYGGGGTEGVDRMIALGRAGRPIPVVGGGVETVCPTHVDDAAHACAAAVDSATAVGRSYRLAGDCLSTIEFARACRGLGGGRSRIVHVPVWTVRIASELARVLPLPLYPDQLTRLQAPRQPSGDDPRADLGFVSRSLAEGLEQAV